MSLEDEIRKLGWNLTAFSRLTKGISPQTVKRIDRGKPARPETLEKIREGLEELRAKVGKAS